MRAALVIGATSDIGRAIARRLAGEVQVLQLAGRDAERLEREAADLRLRGNAQVTVHRCDVLERDAGAAFLDGLDPLPELAVCAVGGAANQRVAERDPGVAEETMRTNYVGPALLLGAVGERFAARGSGVIVGISSVSGERGRRSNYVYGSAKAGFTAFLSGLRHRLAGGGVHVVTVKAGWVRTEANEGMRRLAWLTAEPADVADAVSRAVWARRNVVYVRGRWRVVMAVVRAIPEPLFKRLPL